MKNRLLFIVALMFSCAISVQGQGNFEQYYYLQKKQPVRTVPIFHMLSTKNWYGEARYNYEETGAFSLYAGKSFSKAYKQFYYSVTPVAGVVFGKLNGVSLGLNLALETGDLYFYSQSQVTFLTRPYNEDFLFTWAELVYEPSKWFYFGLSVQHTAQSISQHLVECGPLIAFTAGNWSLSAYGFGLTRISRYFVMGIALQIDKKKTDQ